MRWTAPFKLHDLIRVGQHALPKTFELRSHNDEPQPDVRLRFDLVDGAYQCREMTLTAREGGREVNTTDLRAVHIDDLLEEAARMIALTVEDQEDGSVVISPVIDDAGEEAAVRQVRGARTSAKRSISRALLAEAAAVYEAHEGDAPTLAVADHFGKARRTASLYIKQARDAGLLGRTGEKGPR